MGLTDSLRNQSRILLAPQEIKSIKSLSMVIVITRLKKCGIVIDQTLGEWVVTGFKLNVRLVNADDSLILESTGPVTDSIQEAYESFSSHEVLEVSMKEIFESPTMKLLLERIGKESDRIIIEALTMDKSEEWRKKATECDSDSKLHEWIPLAWSISPHAKHVSTLMCAKCFHEINISEAFEHRIKL